MLSLNNSKWLSQLFIFEPGGRSRFAVTTASTGCDWDKKAKDVDCIWADIGNWVGFPNDYYKSHNRE